MVRIANNRKKKSPVLLEVEKRKLVPEWPCPSECGFAWSIYAKNTGICPNCGRKYHTSLDFDKNLLIKWLEI